MVNPYEILGLQLFATEDEIKKAHRVLAKRYHPDINLDPQACVRFLRVQQAYEILSNPEKRRFCDERLRATQFQSAPAGQNVSFRSQSGSGAANQHTSTEEVWQYAKERGQQSPQYTGKRNQRASGYRRGQSKGTYYYGRKQSVFDDQAWLHFTEQVRWHDPTDTAQATAQSGTTYSYRTNVAGEEDRPPGCATSLLYLFIGMMLCVEGISKLVGEEPSVFSVLSAIILLFFSLGAFLFIAMLWAAYI